MNEKLKIFFDERIAKCEEKRAALLGDGRQDEADMEKVRGNVYDIYRTVMNAGLNTQADSAAARGFFFARLAQIPAAWQAALEKAREHSDDVQAAIELVKLEAAADIRAHAEKLWEVEA